MSNIYLIGNAHLDPVWLWRWQEGYSEVLATFRSALDRLNEFDDFVFTCAGAAYYNWVEESDPQMFSEIRQRVKEGRWVIVGGWWIQPDCNAPSGESYARHALYSQRYFKEKFGVTAKVGYNVDSFGHNGMIPQLIKNADMDAYVFMRPSTKEKQYPFPDDVFMWESPDGTKVPAFRILESYCTNDFEKLEEKAVKHLEISDEEKLPLMCFYGVGNHGGGPTIKNLQILGDLIEREGKEKYKLSSPDEYFAELDKSNLKTLKGDIQNHAVGCFTAVMKIKELNRESEAKLYSAETFNSAAKQLGLGGTEDLSDAWKKVLFNQFHDIMGGCCMRAAVDDAVKSYGYSCTLADETENRALQKIAWNIDTSKGLPVLNERHNSNVRHVERIWERNDMGVPVVLFNPLPFEVTEPVNLGFVYSSVTDNDGNDIPLQTVRSTITNCEFGLRESRIVATVPACGWKLFWCYGKRENKSETKNMLNVSEEVIENNWFKIKLENGNISSVIDKEKNCELLNEEVRAIVLDEKHCDTWAHDVFKFDKVIGEFTAENIKVVEEGDICATIRINSRYNNSAMQVFLTLYRDIPEVYLDYRVNWQEEHKMLKVEFPTVFKNGKTVKGIPYGFLETPSDRTESPMQNFLCIGEDDYGLGISTDTRSAYDSENGVLRVTALRSPIFADHYGWRDDRCEFTEQGEHRFNLNIGTFKGDYSKTYNSALCLATPIRVVLTTYHKGNIPSSASAVECDKVNVRVSAFKTAEDKNGYILRCHETGGKETDAVISLPFMGKKIEVHLTPQQIKTFRITETKITETNFLEF